MLGPGASGSAESADLTSLRAALPGHGVAVAVFEQPHRTAGRRAPDPPPKLDEAFIAAVTSLRSRLPGVPLVVGGRSAGARVACRTAGGLGAVGVLALAFPLHPPGRPERSRADELLAPGRARPPIPVLVLQGERDPFGRPAELPPGPTVHPVAGADHALRPRSGRGADRGSAGGGAKLSAELAGTVAGWLAALLPAAGIRG